MKKPIQMLIFVLLVLSILPAFQGNALLANTKANSFEGNDNGGYLRFGCNQGPLARAEMEAKIREFIWTHWTQRRKGQINATYCGFDTSLTSTFSIRKGSSGDWMVTEKFIERWPFFWKTDDVVTNTYHDVSRLEVVSDSEMPKLISQEPTRVPDSYRILLKAENTAEDFIL